jgi:general secretion pathway protein D
VNPLTSFSYRPIGVIVEMTPRVTYDGEIIMDLIVESSARGRDSNIAGQNLPSFGSRKVATRLRLRDGESNLLAGLLREDERRALRGIAGVLRLPVLRELFSSTDSTIQQTDIVMLLTPRIIRTHELTQADLTPIYIGTQGNLSLGGPPPLFGVPEPVPQVEPQPMAAVPPTAVTPQVPPGSSPIPGTTMAPAPPPAEPPSPITVFPPPPETPVAEPVPAPAADPLLALVTVTPPATEFTAGGGPYTVPISISGADRLTTITMSLTYNPAVLRVRSVQEGTFMRQGGINAAFSQQVDAASGRVDIVIIRTGDSTGAAGSGLLAAVMFEAVAAGSSTLAASGVGTAPGGVGRPLQFVPATVIVR